MSADKTSRNRRYRAGVAAETLRILDRGSYQTPQGTVSIAADLRAAVAGTRLYVPDEPLPHPVQRHQTAFCVVSETTLAGCRRLTGHRVVALNFASARNPGGGFLKGSQAQEESIARSSGLHACIAGSGMYTHNRAHRQPLYSDHMIHSPGVPVFRDDDGALLAEPYRCAFLSAPAVNRKYARQNGKGARHIEAAMRQRIRRVLCVMAAEGHDTIVLGAWGCGVFGNDPDDIAAWLSDALTGELAGVFKTAVFSIPDRPGGRFILPFQRRFG
jgi:uncharacterized protein (TIGR02452 family)